MIWPCCSNTLLESCPTVCFRELSCEALVGFYTDHVLSTRHPDIAVMNKKETSAQIIDVAVPADCNVTGKEAEKVEKYRDHSIELISLWKRKCEVIPIVVGCLGCVTHTLESNLKKLSVFDLCNVELLQ